MFLEKHIAQTNSTRQFFKRKSKKSHNAKLCFKNAKRSVQKILDKEFQFEFNIRNNLITSTNKTYTDSSISYEPKTCNQIKKSLFLKRVVDQSKKFSYRKSNWIGIHDIEKTRDIQNKYQPYLNIEQDEHQDMKSYKVNNESQFKQEQVDQQVVSKKQSHPSIVQKNTMKQNLINNAGVLKEVSENSCSFLDSDSLNFKNDEKQQTMEKQNSDLNDDSDYCQNNPKGCDYHQMELESEQLLNENQNDGECQKMKANVEKGQRYSNVDGNNENDNRFQIQSNQNPKYPRNSVVTWQDGYYNQSPLSSHFYQMPYKNRFGFIGQNNMMFQPNYLAMNEDQFAQQYQDNINNHQNIPHPFYMNEFSQMNQEIEIFYNYQYYYPEYNLDRVLLKHNQKIENQRLYAKMKEAFGKVQNANRKESKQFKNQVINQFMSMNQFMKQKNAQSSIDEGNRQKKAIKIKFRLKRIFLKIIYGIRLSKQRKQERQKAKKNQNRSSKNRSYSNEYFCKKKKFQYFSLNKRLEDEDFFNIAFTKLYLSRRLLSLEK